MVQVRADYLTHFNKKVKTTVIVPKMLVIIPHWTGILCAEWNQNFKSFNWMLFNVQCGM